MCPIDRGLWCWDATTQAASDDAPSQRRGWRGVLSFSFEVRVRQGRVTLPCKSLRGVRAPNRGVTNIHSKLQEVWTTSAPSVALKLINFCSGPLVIFTAFHVLPLYSLPNPLQIVNEQSNPRYSSVRKVCGQMPKHTKRPTFQHTRTAPSHLIRAFNFTNNTYFI